MPLHTTDKQTNTLTHNNALALGGAPAFGGISKLLFQNSITYFLVNQSLIDAQWAQ